jgi:hypothetical protein
MFNVYFWSARYSKGEDILIIGANSKEEAREIVDINLKKYGSTIEEIFVFEKIPKVKTDELGILEVY